MAPYVANKSIPGSGNVESTAMMVGSEGEEQEFEGSTAPDMCARADGSAAQNRQDVLPVVSARECFSAKMLMCAHAVSGASTGSR